MNTLSRLTDDRQAALEREVKNMLRPKIEAIVDQVRIKHGIPKTSAFTESDFYAICTREGIELANAEAFSFMASCKEVLGCLMRFKDGTMAVYVRGWHTGESWEQIAPTAWHEIGHFYLHDHYGNGLELRKADPPAALGKELEADLFADCALIAS